MKPIAITLFLLAALLLPQPHEREPNDSPETASALLAKPGNQPDFVTSRHADGVVLHGRLVPGDVDYFRFLARAGDVVTISLFESERGGFHDPVLAVSGPGDSEPVAMDDDAGPGFLPRVAVPIDRTGTWTIAVGGFGDEDLDGGDHEQSFEYDLVVAVDAQPVRLREWDVRGGNDDARFAELLLALPGRSVVVSGELRPGDVDHFLLPVLPRAVVTASLYDDQQGEFNDSVLRMLDARGNLLAEDDDSGPGFLSNLGMPIPFPGPLGFRVLSVTGFDPHPTDTLPHEERFRYRLAVSLAWPHPPAR